MTRRRIAAAALALAGFAGTVGAQSRPAPLPPSAQQGIERLRREQEQLDQLRQERAELEARMQRLRTSARDMTAERLNLERQAAATARLVRSLERQLGALQDEVLNVNTSLARTQDELRIKQAALRFRVQEIYKRGPLHEMEALLSAESFGALVARYKYLHLAARRDRALVGRVETLTGQITSQRTLLERLASQIEGNRRDKAEEEQRLLRLQGERGRALAQIEAETKRTQDRMRQIQRDEQRLAGVIAALEETRRRTEARPNAAPTTSTLTTADLGRLDWPVDGSIVYRFGRQVNPDNTSIRWNGIGIGASIGTPVKAVEAGEVVFAEPSGTYGLTVLIQHGGGAYSLYASLQSARVRRGTKVNKGDVIGTVGQADPDLPPRLHFEMRPRDGIAVDPLEWLRGRR